MMLFVEVLVVIILVGIDQLSKYEVINRLKNPNSFEVIKNFFYLRYEKNTGVAFSMFSGQVIVMAFIGVVAILGMLWYYSRNRNKIPIMIRISLILIFSGAIGNTYDRITRGYVVDFIDFSGIWHAIFNVADSYLTIGAVLIIVHSLIKKNKKDNHIEDKIDL